MSRFRSRIDGIGERMREARTLLGITQQGLADELGVSRPAVSQWETGAMHPELATLERAAHVLAVRAGWLAFGEEPRER